MDTLGALTDKLSIVNIKLFNVQDLIHRYAALPGSEFAEIAHADIHDTLKKLKNLNVERNRLMTAIDQCFAEGVASGIVAVDPRVKII